MAMACLSRFLIPGAKLTSPASIAYWISRSRWARQAWCAVWAQPICAPSRSDTQKSGRIAPRNSPTTALPRLGRLRKQALSPLWKTQVHHVFLPTRALVSSDCRMVPDNNRSRIRFVWRAKAPPLASSMLARAPSLISSPSKSDISRASRSNGIAWAKRKYSTKARRFGPNGEPGAKPAGGVARNRRLQHGQRPPCSVTRVTSGNDLRDLDPVIGVNRRLRDRAHIGATMLAAIGQDVAPPRRVRVQRPVGSDMGLG